MTVSTNPLKTGFGGAAFSVNVKDLPYGARGDGVTDDTAAIQAAITRLLSLGGGDLHFEPGSTYKITDIINVTGSNIRVFGHGSVIDASGIAVATAYNQKCAFNVSGTLGAGVAVTVDIAVGDKQINVADTSGFTAGDLFLLRSADEVWPTGATVDPGNSRKGALHYARSIDSALLMTLTDGSFFSFAAASNATVKKLTPVKNVEFHGLDIRMGGANKAHCGILFFYAVECWVRECSITDAEETGVRFNFCCGGGVENSEITKATSPDTGTSGVTVDTGYGVSLASGSRNIVVRKNRFRQNKHSVTGGGDTAVIFCDVVENSVDGGRFPTPSYVMECHEECSWWNFDRNKISGSVDSNGSGGLMIRGQGCVVSHNMIVNSWQYGILVQCFDDNANGLDGVKLIGNVIDKCRLNGINILGSVANPIKNVEIRGNTIRNTNGDGIRASVTDGLEITDNSVYEARTGSSCGIRLIGSATANDLCKNVILSGNRINGAAVHGMRLDYSQKVIIAEPHITNITSSCIQYTDCSDVAQTGGYFATPGGTITAVLIVNGARTAVNGGVFLGGGTPSTNSGVGITGTSNDISVVGILANNFQYPVRATGTVNYIITVGINGRLCAAAIDTAAAANRVDANNL
jgi:hypothetical protein